MRSPLRTPRSIRAHLVALLAVTVLPLLWLLVHATRHEYDLALRQGQLRAHTLADATATSARALLDVVRDALETTAVDPGAKLTDPAGCAARLSEVNRTLAFLPNVLVADLGGQLVCSSHAPEQPSSIDVSGRDWFQQIATRGSSVAVGAPMVGGITGLWVVAVAVPVRGAGGQLEGVLAASVPLVTFQDLLAGVTLGPNDLVTIANVDRVIVARSRDPDTWVGRTLPPAQARHEDVEQGFVGTEAADATGTERTWASVEIPELGWTVHGGIPLQEALVPARASLRGRIYLGALTLLLVGVLGWLIQRRITGSLRELVQTTADDGSVVVSPGAPTEVAEVAERFNRALLARLRAEREERRAKERFRSIVDNAVLGIYVSTEDGAFLEVNPAFVRLMGYESADELLSTGPEALYPDPAQRRALVDAYSEGDLVNGLELQWRRKDGTTLTVRLHGSVIQSSGGQRAFEIMVEDVTEQRRLEDQLHMTQKMEAVGRLAGGLAHDFNNVLTVIRVNAELADAELGPENAGHGGIEEIVRATEGAQRLTRQLLSFSRKRETEPRLVRPNEVIRGVEKMLVRLIGEDVRLEADLDPEVPWVRMDPGHLEQILMNLAVNARDALPNGGRISLATSVSATRLAAGGSQAEASEGPWILLRVEDDGLGMDPETRDRVFEPFFTTKGAGHGTGLGLATAYAIVTGAGGHIAVDSAPGEGTRFDIWLPAVTDGPPEDEVIPGVKTPDRGAGETILLVEDNMAVRRAVQRTLESAGYHVLVARDGQEGIDHLHGFGGHLHLVLTDVVMPNVSGPELADHVDRVRPTTPILFMSGYTAGHPMAERVARQGVGFIPKPFEISELLSRVRAAIQGVAAAPTADEDLETGSP